MSTDSNVEKTSLRKPGLWLVVIALACLAVVLVALWVVRSPAPNRNQLALGPQAKLAALDIPLQTPTEFDFMTKAEVLRLRMEAVRRYPDLLASDYAPSEAVFGQIVDGLPWWGIAGQFYYGPGGQSIEGVSEESRFVLNPYLLVAAEFYGMVDRNATPEFLTRSPDFQFYCAPTRLHWQPQARYAEAAYDAGCVARLGGGRFDLIVYNARDMNLNYIYVSYADSRNVATLRADEPRAAYAIPQFLHQGGSCGYPGGCNNMSPPTPEIDGIEITGLPARVVAWLWRARPLSVNSPPEMTFVLEFR